MCTNPLTIKNNRLDYRADLHARLLTVPCGCCAECIDIKRNELQLRAMYEARRECWTHHVMLLFTYDDSHVPYLYYHHDHIMCHDMKHISLMIDILRRLYGKEHFWYMIGAEYGIDLLYTQRPHYHGLFGLDDTIDYREFCETCRRIWTGQNYCRDEKQDFRTPFGNLGFMFPAPDEPSTKFLCRDEQKSAAYCAKYCCKQLGFIEKNLVKQLKKHDVPKCDYRDSVPRMVATRGFGIDAILSDSNTNIVDCTCHNYLWQKTVSLPTACVERLRYHRKAYKRVPLRDNNGVQRKTKKGVLMTRLVYDRLKTNLGEKQQMLMLDSAIKHRYELYKALKCDDKTAYRFSIYHYVYKHLPTTIIPSFGINDSNVYTPDMYRKVYYKTRVEQFLHSKPNRSRDVQYFTMDLWLGIDFTLYDSLNEKLTKEKLNTLEERLKNMNNSDKYRQFQCPH